MLKASSENSEDSILENNSDDAANNDADSALPGRNETDKVLNRYRLLLEKARDIILLLRLDGQITEVNEAAVHSYGYTREELLRMNIRDLREKSTLVLLDKQLKQADESGIQFETVHVRKDGTMFPVEVNSTGANFGNEHLVMSIVRDITERRAAENDLKRQKALLEALSESILDGILIVSPDGQLLHHNQHFLDVWKFPADVLETNSDQAILQWTAEQTANPKAFLERVSAIYEQPESEVREEISMKDGRVYERYGAPIGSGDAKYGWVWTFRDITERKRAEDALRESEERFVKAFNSSPLSITITSLQSGKLVDVNDTFANITGYTREEATGKTTAELGLWSNPTDREKELSSVIREGQIRNLEYVFRMRNGTEIVGLLSAELIEIGGEKCALTVIQDITERKQVERERELMLRNEQELRLRAEEANRLKDEFLATVSHELRTPLNAILGWSAMVRQSNFDPEIMRRAFEIVERNSRNQNQIISDILDVSRIITGKLSLNMKPVPLQTVIQAAVDTLRPAIEAKQIKLETSLNPQTELINGDSDRLQQIFWNLISNAVKFNSDGGSIKISLDKIDDYAEITVSDEGIGISPEFLPYVFDRFRQADSRTNRIHGGLGLGLAIVRHLTELHGGNVSVESDGSGKGSRFTIRFPLKNNADDSEISANVDSIAQTKNSTRKRLAGMKILIVDDEADSLELASFILTSESAEVFTANSVDKALEIFEKEDLNLVITDIGMPEKDGYELIREIKQRIEGKPFFVPALALTAYAGEDDNRRVLQAGFQSYMPKPVEPSELINRVVALTDLKRQN